MHSAYPKKLLTIIFLTFIVFIVEVIGSQITHSLSLISDAAHMLTDLSVLLISWIAIRLAEKPKDIQKTFGYYRVEVLAAALNTMLLFFVSIYILFESYQRILTPKDIGSSTMIWIAALGLICNFISIIILKPEHQENINLQSAYLEIIADTLSSIGVILAGVIIYFYQWYWMDSIIAILIGIWILPRSWFIFKDSINILLESVPKHINFTDVQQSIQNIEGITAIQDLHIWSINDNTVCLTTHIIINNPEKHNIILNDLKQLLSKQFNIQHITIQIEHQMRA